jgi:hypothetical protein
MGMEGPSKRIVDPAKAETMARASNDTRTRIEDEKKLNNGSEFSLYKDREFHAEYEEDTAKAIFEIKEKAKNMSASELAYERSKMASILNALIEEEQERGSR